MSPEIFHGRIKTHFYILIKPTGAEIAKEE